MPCDAAIVRPDRPSERSCSISFALIFRTIGLLLPPCALYTRREERKRGGPRPHHEWPRRLRTRPQPAGPRTRDRWTPVKRIFSRVLKLSRQPYYRWLADPVTPNEVVEAYRANALFDAHKDDPEFGHRLLADEARDVGEPMADRTAWRITSSNGWWSVFGKKRAKNGKNPGPPAHDDLCAVVDEHGRTRHVFAATRANELWLVDITEHGTAEGKLYCCAIKDAFSRRIVGYSIDSRMKSRLAVQALENAVQMRGDVVGCVVHSDRGSQFRSRKFLRALAGHDMVGSMGRVGSSGDNAAMESFFSLLQKNVLDRGSWITREQLRIAIVTWIERTYHRRRRQARLGRLTPIEFEAIMTKDVALAA
nr:IS3 family transposase [Corynebacterium doosanense]